MKCTSCGAPIPLSHRPGVFLFVAGLFGAGAVVAAVALPWTLAAAALLVSLWCAGNAWAEKSDAVAAAKPEAAGDEPTPDENSVTCPSCGTPNRVHAWTL